MSFQLVRPLIWLDVETHDKCPPEKAHICELGFEMTYPDGRVKTWERFIKPPVPISSGAEEVHGISNAMVAEEKPFAFYAASLAVGFANCDYGGYHVTFDLKCLQGEMDRAGVPWSYEGAYLVDPLRLWQVSRPRKLADAVREHCKREPRDSHRALADALDARDTGLAMLDLYSLPRTPEALHTLCLNPDQLDDDGKIVWNGPDACIGFGKWNGTPLAKVVQLDAKYLQWMMKADFSSSTKRIVRDALSGKYPVKP